MGELTDVKTGDTSKPFLTVEQVLNDYLGGLKKPVLTGLVYGHVPRKLTIPLGIRATVDSKSGHLTVNESAVR
jgi:muramoyltetrapeptide carboxypeptidase